MEDINKLEKIDKICSKCKLKSCKDCETFWSEVEAITNILKRCEPIEEIN